VAHIFQPGDKAVDTRVNKVVTIKAATRRQAGFQSGEVSKVNLEYTVLCEIDGHTVEQRNVPAEALVAPE
jgi:hypothetical protein